MFRLQGRAAGTVAQPAATIEPALWLRFFKQAWTAKKFALIDRSLGADDAMKLGILHTQPKPPRPSSRRSAGPRDRRRGRPAAAPLPAHPGRRAGARRRCQRAVAEHRALDARRPPGGRRYRSPQRPLLDRPGRRLRRGALTRPDYLMTPTALPARPVPAVAAGRPPRPLTRA